MVETGGDVFLNLEVGGFGCLVLEASRWVGSCQASRPLAVGRGKVTPAGDLGPLGRQTGPHCSKQIPHSTPVLPETGTRTCQLHSMEGSLAQTRRAGEPNKRGQPSDETCLSFWAPRTGGRECKHGIDSSSALARPCSQFPLGSRLRLHCDEPDHDISMSKITSRRRESGRNPHVADDYQKSEYRGADKTR